MILHSHLCTMMYVYFRFLCKDTVEEKIVELQKRKQTLAKNVLTGYVTVLHLLHSSDFNLKLYSNLVLITSRSCIKHFELQPRCLVYLLYENLPDKIEVFIL